MTAKICIHKMPCISFICFMSLRFIMRLLEICICYFLTSYQAIWQFTAIHNNNLILHTSTITARGEERTALSSKRRYPSLLLSAADIVARMIFSAEVLLFCGGPVLKRFQLIHQRIKCQQFTMINRLRGGPSLSPLMTSVVMGSKM